jgi:predicted HAD superfamily Cof-like phosphohydrolase
MGYYVLMTNFEKVKEFMEKFGQEVRSSPELPDDDVLELRYELIKEELSELDTAMWQNNLIEVADALTDLLYVVYGAGLAFGIDLDKCFEEVHDSNMSKLGADGKPIYREDGKILKGPNFREPDLKRVIDEQKKVKRRN